MLEAELRAVRRRQRAGGRDDGQGLRFEEAAAAGVKTHTQRFALADANEALAALKHDAIKGAAVLDCGS